MGKRWLVLFTLLIMMGMITGCAQYSINITEQQDGSALCEYRLGVNPMILRLISPQGVNPLDDWQQRALAQGFTVQQWQQAHWLEYNAHKRVQSLTEIPPLDSLFVDTVATGPPFKIGTTIFSEQLELREVINLSGIWSNLNAKEAQLVQTLLQDVKIQFIYQTHRNISRHNANVVQHHGRINTLVWYIVPGEDNKILLTAQKVLVRHIIGIGTLVAISVYYILMGTYLLRYRSAVVGSPVQQNPNTIGEKQPQKVPFES